MGWNWLTISSLPDLIRKFSTVSFDVVVMISVCMTGNGAKVIISISSARPDLSGSVKLLDNFVDV